MRLRRLNLVRVALQHPDPLTANVSEEADEIMDLPSLYALPLIIGRFSGRCLQIPSGAVDHVTVMRRLLELHRRPNKGLFR